MRTHAMPLLASLLALAGCHGPLATASAPARAGQLGAEAAAVATAAQAWHGPSVPLTLRWAIASRRELLWVPGYRATQLRVDVAGAGLPGWVSLVSTDGLGGAFGPQQADGRRQATFAASVPAGDRRVFRARLYDTTVQPNLLIDEVWTAENLGVSTGVAAVIDLDAMTTCRGQIFFQLLQINAPKSLELPIENVQHFVEELLNTNAVDRTPLHAGLPQLAPSQLDIDRCVAAIIRGNGGIPFQIPVPMPNDLMASRDATQPLVRTLVPAMIHQGQVHLRGLDMHGQAVARPLAAYVSDPASPVVAASATLPLDTTLSAVTPGAWRLVVNDLDRGTTSVKPITVADGQTTEAFVVLPPALRPFAGAYDREADLADSYSGDQTPASMTYLNDPGGLAIAQGRLFYVDAGNQRLRACDLAPPAIVTTLAGNGRNSANGATNGDGGPATQASLMLDNRRDVAVDKNGVVYLAQANNTLRAIRPDGTVATFWAPAGYSYDGLSGLAYDARRHQLYVACPRAGAIYQLDLATFDGSQPTLGAGSPGVARLPVPFGGYWSTGTIAVGGDYLFAASDDFQAPTKVRRWYIPSGLATPQIDLVVGASPSGPAGDDTPAATLSDATPSGLCVDGGGNLFLRGNAGLYRVANASSGTAANNQWTVKLVVADASLHKLAYDSASGAILAQTRLPFKNANGTVRMVPVIQRIVP